MHCTAAHQQLGFPGGGQHRRIHRHVGVDQHDPARVFACAERTKPHTAAAARSLTSSPANPTAPWVNTTNLPARSAESQHCNTCKAPWVALYTEPTASASEDSHFHTTTPSPSARALNRRDPRRKVLRGQHPELTRPVNGVVA